MRWSFAGVFYPVIIFLVSVAAGAAPASDLDRLEHATRAAYESLSPTAYADFEKHFGALTQTYRELARFQELAWAYYAYGFEDEGRAIEREIIAEMAGDRPVSVERLVDHSARVFLATYPSGLRAVLTGTDHRIHAAPVDPFEDERRYGIVNYEISRSAGLHVVPAATYVMLEEPEGVRKFIGRAYLPDVLPPAGGHEVAPYRDEALHVLDFLTGQVDRNAHGFGYRPGGRVVAFDNRRSFEFMGMDRLGGLMGLPSFKAPGRLSTAVRFGLKRLRVDLTEGSGKHFGHLKYTELMRLLANIDALEQTCDEFLTRDGAAR